jgi:hypothetical protein
MLAAKRAKLCLLKFQTIAVAVTSAELPMCARPTTPTRHETVPCIRLDDLVPTAAVGLIKIDVEGYELQVLEGSSDIIARSNPVLYVENDRVNQSPQLIQWLFDHDYQLWWHLPPLFNPENFFEVKENIYPKIPW